jgi:hypothetical protein
VAGNGYFHLVNDSIFFGDAPTFRAGVDLARGQGDDASPCQRVAGVERCYFDPRSLPSGPGPGHRERDGRQPRHGAGPDFVLGGTGVVRSRVPAAAAAGARRPGGVWLLGVRRLPAFGHGSFGGGAGVPRGHQLQDLQRDRRRQADAGDLHLQRQQPAPEDGHAAVRQPPPHLAQKAPHLQVGAVAPNWGRSTQALAGYLFPAIDGGNPAIAARRPSSAP